MPKTALTSSFRKIIESGSLYIDKTKEIYTILSQAKADDAYFFLARPRRFGKTLLISTLKELFEGNRELFKGLWIDSSDYNWETYPVISLDFSALDSSSSKEFKESLSLELDDKAEELGVTIPKVGGFTRKLKKLVKELAKKNKVVILIDEYDYPLVDNLPDLKVVEGNRKILSNFFTAIKALESELTAFFITGVSQIPKASIFSGMNIPNNLSLDPLAATLLGYTKEEVITHFSDDIAALAEAQHKSFDEVLEEIQTWYNGYRFSEAEVKVYNPFSLHFLFTKKKFVNYWFQSGTPSFLPRLLKEHKYILQSFEESQFSLEGLQSMMLENPQLGPLLFQTGYMTISSYDTEANTYSLAFPNHEVKQSYTLSLVTALTRKSEDVLNPLIATLKESLLDNGMDRLCETISALFAQVPYQIEAKEDTSEAFFHRTFQLLITLTGLTAYSEIPTNKGRIDMVIETPHYTYVFELKAHSSAEAALKQIEDKAYHERFRATAVSQEAKKIVLVGLSFTKEEQKATVTCKSKVISFQGNVKVN